MTGNRLSAGLVIAVFALLVVLAVADRSHAAEPPAVVVAVDTSRSLSAAELDEVAAVLRGVVERLPAGTRSGLVVFNDEAAWQVPFGSRPGEVAAGLAQLQPRGSYTVLHDALFIATRELSGGGVILLVSDGRDERSATTVEDVARLCSDNGVRVVTASLGRRVDDRALRRLALLTDGSYAGRLPAAGQTLGQALDRAVGSARTAAAGASGPALQASQESGGAAASETSEAAAGRGAAAEQAPAAAGEAEEAEAGRSALLLPLGAGLLGLLLVIGWLLIRGLRHRSRSCALCGAVLEEWEESCPVCQIKELESATESKAVAAVAVPDESLLDPKVYVKTPLPDELQARLENTIVIDEQPVVIVRRRGEPTKTYSLPEDQIFAVGRAPKVNSLQLQDPAVSAQHCKLVPKDGEYYVVDLDTTNGTFVNRERITVRKLKAGDLIGAGTTELEFNLSVRRLA